MYWLCSLPLIESSSNLPLSDGTDRTWNTLQQLTTYTHDYSVNYKFHIPELRVGTLDSLMVLSDDLVKVNALIEAVVNKIRRQLFELSVLGEDSGEVLVEGVPPESYLELFSWDEAKYPPRRPLKETVDSITETIQQLEDSLKVGGGLVADRIGAYWY
jgi:V-type H+-transporting ATPase subunit C